MEGWPAPLETIVPATHGFLALQQVPTYVARLQEIAFRLGATTARSLLCLALGLFVSHHLKMRDRG